MKKLIALLIAVTCCISFAACDQPSTDSSSNDETKLNAATFNLVEKKCVVEKDNNYQQSIVSFYDDNYNYWIFDMGYLTDVPLEESHSYYKYMGGNIEYKFTTTVATANSIKTITEKTISKSNTWSNTDASNVELDVGIGDKDSWHASVNLGCSNSETNGGYNGTSWAESFEKCEAYTKTQENTVTIAFDDSCEKGYYRYVLLGTVQVYAAIIQDRNTKSYYANTYSDIKSYGYCLDFDKESALFDKYDDNVFEFDLSCVNNLKEPTRYISSIGLTLFDKTIRSKDEAIKIPGSGKYSLDTFTIDEDVSELIENGYKKLKITITYDLKEVDNCKQYISLYTSTNYMIKKETIEHGGSQTLTGWETYTMDCTVELIH